MSRSLRSALRDAALSAVRHAPLVLLLLLVRPSSSQSQSTVPAADSALDTIFHLHGTVVDGITGKPLARARVASRDQRLGALTDHDGHFALDVRVPSIAGQPAAAYFLQQAVLDLTALKPGYTERIPPPPVRLTDPAAAGAIVLRLMPNAELTGSVSASKTDTPENVRVLLLRRTVQEGYYHWQQTATQSTDERGRFRFDNLVAGQYTVLTATWHDPATDAANPTPARNSALTPRDDYAAIYNGDVRTLAAATLIPVRFGQTAHAEIHLHPTRFYPVELPAAVPSPTSNVNVGFVGAASFEGLRLRYNQQTQSVQGLLPAGAYTLLLTSSERIPPAAAAAGQPQTDTRAYVTVPLTVSAASVQAAAVALAPAANIPIRVQALFTSKDSPTGGRSPFLSSSGNLNSLEASAERPPIQSMFLRALETGTVYGGGQYVPTSSTTAVLKSVSPATYSVQIYAGGGYVASMTCGGVDLLVHPLVAGASAPAPIDILLLDNTATLTGGIAGSDPPPGRFSVLLYSTDGTSREVKGYGSEKGVYTAGQIPPGSYLAFAFTGPDPQLPFHEPHGLRALEGKAKAVTVAAGQKLQADLPLLDPLTLEDQ